MRSFKTLVASAVASIAWASNISNGSGGNTITIGALASRPASSALSGNMYVTTDALYNFVWTGAAWQAFYGSIPVVPPVAASFSWVNQGTASLVTSDGGITITAAQATNNLRLQCIAAPAAPWTAEMLIAPLGLVGNTRVGVAMRESGTGKIVSFSSGGGGVSNGGYSVDRWTNATTFAAQPASGTFAYLTGATTGLWLRPSYDSTNIKFSVSTNGTTWVEWFSEAATTGFTTAPDQVCFLVVPEGVNQQGTLVHFTF